MSATAIAATGAAYDTAGSAAGGRALPPSGVGGIKGAAIKAVVTTAATACPRRSRF